MKAISINKYGSVEELKMVELPIPTLKPNEVLVKNHYTTVNPWDYKVRNGSMKFMTGSKFPKILGSESTGVVEEVGANVKGFKKGDRVAVVAGLKNGSYTEYIAVPDTDAILLPENVSFQQGASLPIVGTTAYNALHQLAKIKAGDHILINAAYGGVGIAAVQLAKLAGAKVTAVCSTDYIENVKALGVDSVVDYTKQNIYALNQNFDLIFDTISVLDFDKAKAILKSNGVMINTLPTPKAMLKKVLTSFSSKKFNIIMNKPTADVIKTLLDLVAQSKLKVIFDKEFALEEMQKAHLYSETGKAKGKILIKI
jgi:NADPH:quinone reductase-like Zn-dependent oxidoreductase